MNESRFAHQMNRLAKQFPNAYSEERVKLIWREVQAFSDHWLERVVDRFLGELRQAPLIPEFREEASRERERLREIEKRQEASDAKAFMSALSDGEVSEICGQIRKRVEGRVSDEDFNKFQGMLKSMLREVPK
jgi:hypothetical protein